ncbi:PREDICTED: transcription termination factor 2 [Cyphomyrmex costatus]|uniref:Transcription termination factor 2 n=1 Tax=Cyphomyrmex costatus TaxID=456900 RepID=A0A195CNZ3_9HYME|nr:PREDICTED: transcription termination factor 2 [Cyphomyrmex costatus]KYN02202.1 Transcription termination factor 2 [Cyphomyrmex costatus]
MESSFTQWRDSSGYRIEGESVIISDSSEEEVVGCSRDGNKEIIDESAEIDDDDACNLIEDTTPTKDKYSEDDHTPIVRPFKNLNSKKTRRCILDSDSDNEQINDHEDNDEAYHTINDFNNFDSRKDFHDDYDEEYYSDFNSESDSSISPSRIKNKGKKRKYVSHDNTKEDIKELKPSSSNDSFINMNLSDFDEPHKQNNTDHQVSDVKNKTIYDVPVTIELDSDSTSGQNSDSEVAKSYAKEETSDKNIDSLTAQKRALTLCKLEQLKHESSKMKLLLSEVNMDIFPDKGQKLQERIRQREDEIKMLTHELENTSLVPHSSSRDTEGEVAKSHFTKESQFFEDELDSEYTNYPYLDIDNIPMRPTTSPELRQLGEKAQATRDKELALTVERLQDLHGSLVARPSEKEKAEDPKGLKVQLMPHQQHALAWLLWREQQRPSGGVLADDMGLGKTLTMIALVLTTLAQKDFNESDDEREKETTKNKSSHYKGSTLVVCPASLLSQWENEVRNRCKRGLLSVEVHHGSNRQSAPKKLARNDLVITTYNILSREYKTNSTLYKINWKRVILDEAHVVRNPKSQASEAVCGLVANKRWALTGTPIQNKELDLYSILKFLKCSPFDDLRVWKRWVDNKNAAGHQRLATVMKTLMLRRTKQELMSNGELENLPDKSIEEVIVQLDQQEQLVYEKVLAYSRTLFAQFLAQRAEKDHMLDLHSGKYNKPSYFSNPNKETQFTKAQNKLLALHADVKTHEILVLLLRLRQVCCHPALIHAMLDQEDLQQSGIMDIENVDMDLLSRVHNISLNGIDNKEEENTGVDRRIMENLLTIDNPVFDDDRISSKMKVLLNMVKDILQRDNDKIIIVSQWTMLLEVIASHLPSIKGATFNKFTGKVPIKDRQGIMESFNNLNSGPRILLLSLTAGGVGLNLVGGNHLLLFDIHWNPQLETQAQDRIYRFGQTKNVYIYKFICVNTIEERIKMLQERKLQIANNVLSGGTSNAIGKLTLNDLKSLFGF